VTKTATLLGISRVSVSKVGIHKTWEDIISEEEQWAKIGIDRNRSSYTEKDCFDKSQLLQHRWQQNWIFILKTMFPQKFYFCWYTKCFDLSIQTNYRSTV
jgi:hypothetical protein